MQLPELDAFIAGYKEPPVGIDPAHWDMVPIFHDYIEAPELAGIGDMLIRTRLTHLAENYAEGRLKLIYRWKRKGGTSQGAAKLGMCQKLNPVARKETGAQYMIWLARDHLEMTGYTSDREIEALVYHELNHISVEEHTDRNGNQWCTYHIRAHDFDGFFAELQEYGPWRYEQRELVDVIRQLSLPGLEAEPIPVEVPSGVQHAARSFISNTFSGAGIDSITVSAGRAREAHDSVTITRDDARRAGLA